MMKMEHGELHSILLERLVGKIRCELVNQSGDFRMVHLRDTDGISRTLGLVRFNSFKDELLKQAHLKIKNGELLGKTLQQEKLNFDKEFHGTFELRLPKWLMEEFRTEIEYGLAIYSSISVKRSDGSQGTERYADVLEIVPQPLRKSFEKYPRIHPDFDKDLIHLCNFGGILLNN